MHLTDREIAALTHGDPTAMTLDRATAHLETCAECADRLRSARLADRETAELLRLLDHPPPAVHVESGRAHARRGWPRLWPVAAALGLCAAGAAAAIPASPLHRALVRAFASQRAARPPVVPAPPAPDIAAARPGAGIALLPRERTIVHFRRPITGSRVVLRFVDSPQLSLVPLDGDAAFEVHPGRLTVGEGAATRFTLSVPRAIAEIEVRAGTTVVFRGRDGRGVAGPSPDDAGGYRLDLAPGAPPPAAPRP